MSNTTEAKAQAPVRKYELGQPFVRREQRLALETIHRTLAQTWSDTMTKHLPGGGALEFAGAEFATFSSVSLDRSPGTQLAMFSIASTPISGFLMLNGALTKFLVSGRLGLKAAAPDKIAAPFTRIEASIARETMGGLCARLREAYLAAKLGSIGNLRYCDGLADNFVFAPEESLAVLRFRLGTESEDLRILLGVTSSIVGSLAEHQPAATAQGNGRDAIVSALKLLPLEVDVVLGSWKVPLGELRQLRVGEKIVLPDGEDAWLSARGVRIRRANIEVVGNCASIEIRGKVTPQ
jgi:flagellar motor switch protein FliM